MSSVKIIDMIIGNRIRLNELMFSRDVSVGRAMNWFLTAWRLFRKKFSIRGR